MSEIKLLRDSTLSTVINKDATLADAARAAGDYDNSSELDTHAEAYLTVQFDTGPPSAGATIADLYLLPGDGAGTEVFPEGGDGTVGDDVTPQQALYVGSFETRQPSITVDEVLCVPNIPLYGHTNRFVLMNTSGQTFDSTWQLTIKPSKAQVG